MMAKIEHDVACETCMNECVPILRIPLENGKGEVITYAQLQAGAEKVAASLQQYGLKMGDSVAIMLPTGRE